MGRDWRVDTLRGYFLVAMTLGHFPNPVAPFTEYTFGYATAPDGFVFLSGLVTAWVYLPLLEKSGNGAMVSKILRRAGTIYLTHIALVGLVILGGFMPGISLPRAAHPLQTFVSGFLLWNQTGFDRILPMYCVFLAFSPIVLKQFTEGRAWLMGAISAGLWMAAQFGAGPDHFNLYAWQAYFVAGQYIGFRGVRSQGSGLGKSRILLAVCVVIALPLMVDRYLPLLCERNPLLGFDAHPNHNPIRYLDAACLGYLVWWIPRSVDATVMKLRFFRFLNLLGAHSLQVFAFSMLITRFEAHTVKVLSPKGQLVLTLLTVLSLAVPAWVHQVYRKRRRQGQNVDSLEPAPSPLPPFEPTTR
jgi:hypothetical protein